MIVKAQGDVISLSGSLAENHWLTIKATCSLLLKGNPEGILVDCSNLLQCTPAGAHTFSDAIGYIENHKKRIILVNLPPEIRETLTNVPGVRSIIVTAGSIDEARASLKLGASQPVDVRDKGKKGVIVLPLLSEGNPPGALHQAITLSRERNAVLWLVYVLEVPRALALTAPLGEQERLAQQAFDQAEALARKEGVAPSRSTQRARDFSQGLLEAAAALKADAIVFGLPANANGERSYVPVVEALLKRAPCEVFINRTPPARPPNGNGVCPSTPPSATTAEMRLREPQRHAE